MYGSGGNYQAYEKMGLDIAKKGIEVLQDSSPDKLERFSMIVGGAVGFCLGGKYGKLAGGMLF